MRYISEFELRRTFNAINIYTQIDQQRNINQTFSNTTSELLKSLPNQEFIRPIYTNDQQLSGFISKSEEVLTISFLGLEGNSSRLYYLFTSFDHDDFYDLSCPIASGVKAFYNNLHVNLINTLIEYPAIKAIHIVGYSYGSMVGQLTSVILEKFSRFFKDELKSSRMIEKFYTEYVKSGAWKAYKDDRIAANPKKILDTIKLIDSTVFKRISFDYGCFFGAVNVFEESILEDKDLNHSNFFDKIEVYSLSNDPIGDVFDKRTIIGRLISIFNGERLRILIGKIVILPTHTFLPHHNYTYYLEVIASLLNAKFKVPAYLYRNSPMPFPVFLIPYTCIDFISIGGMIGFSSAINLILGIIMEFGVLFLIYKMLRSLMKF